MTLLTFAISIVATGASTAWGQNYVNPVLPDNMIWRERQRYKTPQPTVLRLTPAEQKQIVEVLIRDGRIERDCVGKNGGFSQMISDSVRVHDLDGDGQMEIFVLGASEMCGTMGGRGGREPMEFVFRRSDGNYVQIAPWMMSRDGFSILPTRTKGWSDLGYWSSGALEAQTTIFSYNGKHYVPTACHMSSIIRQHDTGWALGPWKRVRC